MSAELEALSREELIARLRRYETEVSASREDLLIALRELRDVRAALDEHSIVAITDHHGRITHVNEKFCAISKYSREEVIGQDHRIINSGYHPKEFFHELWGTIAHGQVWRGEIRNRAKDGSYYWVDTTIYPFLGESGKPTQYVAIRTDITQRKEDEAELQQFAHDLAEKNKELETIVYTVSHDLRSPLVNVQGFGKQLQRACDVISAALRESKDGTVSVEALRKPVEVGIPQSLRFINAGVSKMEMLLAGLLRYSRLGRVVLSIQRVEVNPLLADIVAAMKFQTDEAGADIELQSVPNCLGDREQVSQVFANILDNALKYRSPARPLKVTVKAQIEDGQAIYQFADNGIGIALEHQPKIFEIFHRLDPNLGTGEGLGLTIAQRMVERQHGKIWVESTEGEGTTMFVSLPVAS